ncbi:MAG: GNAT family N-acetyltransferase [Ruminiclostridium sp.]|nr:GNAT family N-acetyltransferase [Ruminiclostridium sp.]
MTKIYLIRHAEAEGNLYRRMHGHYNSLITDNGYRQIQALAERFRDIPIDAVYSSDLFRTMTTARAICDTKGLPLVTRPDLREIHMGDWEDRTFAAIAMVEPEMMGYFSQSSPLYRAPNGESFQEVRDRGSAAILDIAARHEGQTVAIFAHGTLIRNALAAFQGIGPEGMHKMKHSDNTAVAYLEVEEGKANVIYADDNSHLSEEISTLAQQHWWKGDTKKVDVNLWFRPADLNDPTDRDFYLACRQEAWENLYGTLEGYDGPAFLAEAQEVWQKYPQSLQIGMKGKRPAGLVQVDPDRPGGYICFLYLTPRDRGNNVGVQLLGKAISVLRPLDRDVLRLTCSEKNQVALGFYKKYGFRVVGTTPGVYNDLYEMEKYIGYERRGDLF